MNEEEPQKRKMALWVRIVFAILFPLALFYLFVVPMMAAVAPKEHGTVGVLFGGFMLLQLFMVVASEAYDAARAFYNLREPRIIRTFRHPRERKVSRRGAIIAMFLSYTFLNYAFAVLYVFISSVDPAAFSAGSLSPFQGWYFSVLTGATVAFGDIIPKSAVARVVVMSHITISIAYVVLLFSASSSFLAERRQSPRADKSLPDET